MNIAFLSMVKIEDINSHGIYTDLVRSFIEKGHNVVIIYPLEKRLNRNTVFKMEGRCSYLGIKTGNLQKCGIIEKGISQLLLESIFLKNIKKYTENYKFDLVLYATPPITFYKVIKYLKSRDNAIAYLMLKDIFPQNAVDLGMLGKSGVKGILYRFFRNKEKHLYEVSDFIGCMSPANVDYVLNNNQGCDGKIGLCPNSIIPSENLERNSSNENYVTFIYGGNLGRPQSIPFMISCLERCSNIERAKFIICGTGTELKRLQTSVKEKKLCNVEVIAGLPVNEYEQLVKSADVGLLFLDYRFSIPNFPSRLLSYLDKGLPVLSVTDDATDISSIIEENNCGWSSKSNDVGAFYSAVSHICSLTHEELMQKGDNGRVLLHNDYDARKNVESIINTYNELRGMNK